MERSMERSVRSSAPGMIDAPSADRIDVCNLSGTVGSRTPNWLRNKKIFIS